MIKEEAKRVIAPFPTKKWGNTSNIGNKIDCNVGVVAVNGMEEFRCCHYRSII